MAFLAEGVRDGWIPEKALTYKEKEEESRKSFQDGRLLFLRNWPYVYALAEGGDSKVAGKFGAVRLPGPDGPASGVVGGSNLVINAHSKHQESAADLIGYLTSEKVQRRLMVEESWTPVWADLYRDPAMLRQYPWLAPLRESLLAAKPRPKSSQYEQVSLAIQAVMHDAMTQRETPEHAVERLARELETIIRQG